MREIKFRAYDEFKKVMIHDAYFNGHWWCYQGICEGTERVENAEIKIGAKTGMPVVMQYTGLKDKKGIEIYDGDIIKSDKYMIVYVEWNTLNASWHCYNIKHRFISTWTLGHYITDGITVIGNIYENPELLEE
jgi:uncharacterized phage protein (TIGR01671 family)